MAQTPRATGNLILVGRVLGGCGEAIAVERGRIVAVGREQDAFVRAGRGARRIGSSDAWLVPGFVDAHLHLLALARRRLEVDGSIEVCPSIAALLETLRAVAATRPRGSWIRAFGIDEALLPERRLPSRAELDAVVPRHPVRILHRTGHAAVLNGMALRATGLARACDEGVLYDPGPALAGKVPAAEGEAVAGALSVVSAELAARGVTTIHDPTPGAGGKRVRDLAAHQRAGRVRQRLRFYGDEEVLHESLDEADPEWAKLAGVKLVAKDGDAADRIVERVAALDRRDVSLALHAVEGEALAATVAALAALGPERVRARRHRIEHAGLVPPPLVDEIARLGATVVTHPAFVELFAPKYRASVAEEERPWLYPMAAWRAAGVPLAFGSDAPIAPSEPLRQIAAGAARGLPVAEGFDVHTRGGAYAAFDEEWLGTLDVGMAADVVVLEGDPSADPASAQVVATIIAGEVAFER